MHTPNPNTLTVGKSLPSSRSSLAFQLQSKNPTSRLRLNISPPPKVFTALFKVLRREVRRGREGICFRRYILVCYLKILSLVGPILVKKKSTNLQKYAIKSVCPQCPCSGNTHEKREILERRKSLFDCQVFSPEKEYQACTLHGIVAWFFGRFLGVQCAEGAPQKTVSNCGKVAKMGDKNIVNLQSKFFV